MVPTSIHITASNAKAYCGNGNPVPLVRAVLQKSRDPSRTLTSHMRYGIDNEDNAVLAFIKQQHEVTVRKCGLFIDLEHGQLAASPDRVAFFNGEAVLLEVKCLSASWSMTPPQAVRRNNATETSLFAWLGKLWFWRRNTSTTPRSKCKWVLLELKNVW